MIAGILTACNNDTKVAATSTETKPDNHAPALAYTPAYSASFEMGKPEFCYHDRARKLERLGEQYHGQYEELGS